jgi:hypothetical protein
MKRDYKKPTMMVVLLQNQAQLLAGSDYGGKLNAPAYEWDDELDDEG